MRRRDRARLRRRGLRAGIDGVGTVILIEEGWDEFGMSAYYWRV